MNWPEITIGQVLVAAQYGLSLPTDCSGTIPIVGMKDIKGGKVFIDPAIRVTLTKEQAEVYKLKKGDILLNRTNSPDLVGKSGVLFKDEDAVFASYIVRLTVDRAKADPEYVNYFMNSEAGQRQIRALSTRAISQANINPTTFKHHFYIPLPHVTVQKYIAATLRTWDTGIDKTERLIAAKERQFLWLLNKLIKKGNIKGKWRRMKLGEVAEINKGQQLNVADMVDTGKYYALNGGIEPSGFTNNWNTLENTITISEGGNSCGFVNFNAQKFWCGGHCYALNNLIREIDKKYLYYFLKAHEHSLMSMRVGSGLPNIQKKDLQNFSVIFPPLSEQNIIAETLNTAWQEIDLLKKQAEAYRKQKRGLMQKLLSGQWRGKIDGEITK